LIDSEGIGAFDEDENHDSKIFLLALLLSSYFIYNSMGTIDENAINSLSLIVKSTLNIFRSTCQKSCRSNPSLSENPILMKLPSISLPSSG